MEAEPSEPSGHNTISSSELFLSAVEKRLVMVNATPASSELPSYDSLNRQQGMKLRKIHSMDTNRRYLIMICNYHSTHQCTSMYVFIDLKTQLVDIK
jgi:hypothetical protein